MSENCSHIEMIESALRPAGPDRIQGSSVTTVAKLAGAEWKALSEAQKKPYEVGKVWGCLVL